MVNFCLFCSESTSLFLMISLQFLHIFDTILLTGKNIIVYIYIYIYIQLNECQTKYRADTFVLTTELKA